MEKTELFKRYERACDFDRPIDEKKIEDCLIKFFKGLKIDVTARKINSFLVKGVTWVTWITVYARDARAASDARAARDVSDARAARAAKDASVTRAAWAAKDAKDASVTRAAWDAWAASDASWNALPVINFENKKDYKNLKKWMPYFEAFEAGCWMTVHLDKEILYLPIPKIKKDIQNKCHADLEPAFICEDEIWYFLHGTVMEKWMVMTPADEIDPLKILKVKNAEQRMELLKKVGIDNFVNKAPHKVLDTLGNYSLINFKFNSLDMRYLKMKNPSTGEWHIEGVLRNCTSVREALNWRKPEHMRAIPIDNDNGAEFYQQGDVVIYPKNAKSLKEFPKVLT